MSPSAIRTRTWHFPWVDLASPVPSARGLDSLSHFNLHAPSPARKLEPGKPCIPDRPGSLEHSE